MKRLLCAFVLLAAILQAVAISPRKDWRNASTDFATFRLPEEWDESPSNVHFGLPEFFEIRTDDGKQHKVFQKGVLYMMKGYTPFNKHKDMLIVSHHKAEKGYKLTISDVKSDFDRQMSIRSDVKTRIIWMSINEKLAKGIACTLERGAINGKWIDEWRNYIIYVKLIGSDVYVAQVDYDKDNPKLTTDEYNELTRGLIDSLKPKNSPDRK